MYEKVIIRNTSGGEKLYDVDAYRDSDDHSQMEHFTTDAVYVNGARLEVSTQAELFFNEYVVGVIDGDIHITTA